MTITDTHIYSPKKLFHDLWSGNTVSKHPVSESWTLFPIKNRVYLLIDCLARPTKKQVVLSAAGWVGHSELRRQVRDLPSSRLLHFLTVMIPHDEVATAGSQMHEFLKLVRMKGITVQTLLSPLDSANLIARFWPQAAIA